ncbi:riboflavin kinase [Desertimonas flava]|uniref:riboflavin kinase n=1 Tax=Desertimonas flava TaxID=2064846 RepID=UPI000E347500|nr:riboflavin kinase [Desertimonas flava]
MTAHPSFQMRVQPVAVLGEFDGGHLGHRRLVESAVVVAARLERPVVGIALDVADRPDALTSPEDRARFLVRNGVTACRVLQVSGTDVDADELAKAIQGTCSPAVVMTACAPPPGATGDARYPDLVAALRRRGVDALEVPRVEDADGPITSSRVRAALRQGDVEAARRLRGERYTLNGTVVHGQQLGRTIGFPTANLAPHPLRLVPANGVYAAAATLADGRRFDAAVNVGVRPTVESDGVRVVEAHLLDFDDDIYGEPITLEFARRLRDEQRFGSLDALTEQLTADVADARAIAPSSDADA